MEVEVLEDLEDKDFLEDKDLLEAKEFLEDKDFLDLTPGQIEDKIEPLEMGVEEATIKDALDLLVTRSILIQVVVVEAITTKAVLDLLATRSTLTLGEEE